MAGCAAERDPINRVQANAIPKSFFIGEKLQDTSDDPEFYSRSMIVDVPYGESGANWGFFTNSINSVAKIKWSIEETQLVGRVSFERISGTDGKGLPPKQNAERDPSKPLAQNDGVPVYAFRILSQFDIRRSYNAQTGEETNVVEENATDRPWYEREYVRVDFSQNLVTTAYEFDTMSLLGVYGGVKYQPMALDVRNPNDENAPVYDIENGYLDVTNKLYAEPQKLRIFRMEFPACLLPNIIRGGSEPVGNCNPNEITVRHGFKRVVNTDYEPIDWDGRRFETYGAFTTERNGYARDYGPSDKQWKRYISRYNIWERSHVYKDPEKMEGATACKVDADCSHLGAVAGMSHCDQYNEKCTLPFQDRVAKPIVWHYADKSAPEYFDVTREAAEDWDTAMRQAIQTAKYAECMRFQSGDCEMLYPAVLRGNYADEEDAIYLVKEVEACRREARKNKADPKSCDATADDVGGARGYAPEVIALAKLPETVILCHSPVTEDDASYVNAKGEPYCGKPGTVARLGDLRHHLVTSIATPQSKSPWGIMSDSNDPLTGEHVAASINVWTHVNDLFSRGIIDTFRYIGGELKVEDITDGKYVHDWVEAARRSSGVGLTPQMTSDEVDKRIAATTGVTVERLREASAKFGAPNDPGRARAALQSQVGKVLANNIRRVANTRAALDAPSVNAPIYEARRKLVAGSPIEAQLVTPAMQQLAAAGFGQMALDDDTKTSATSVLQGLFPENRRQLENQIELALAQRGACVMHQEALAPLGYAAMADILQEKFGRFNAGDDIATQAERADKMKDYLRRRAHYSVVSHEMGHSFGLRHNFVSSSDAWNFRPQYWALRTDAKRLEGARCDESSGGGDGKNCVGPRWLDKVTPNENKNLIHLWTQSSTMEYAGEVSQDMLGLGAYDFGAARMFYGDVATVYDESRFKVSQNAGLIARGHQNDFGGLIGFRYGEFASPIHYSHLDTEVNLIEKCDTSVNPQAFQPSTWNESKDGKWNPVIDGHLVTNEAGKWTRCTQPKVDFVQWTALEDSDTKTHAIGGREVSYAKDKVRVPHGFASDEWADLGNIEVFRHDNGADLYERMHFWIAQQEMNHIFTNYRRGRRDFSVWGAFQRTLSRYHEKMRDAAKGLGLYINISKDTVTQFNAGPDPMALVASIMKEVGTDHLVASSIAFDHFAHVFARPQPGPHGDLNDEIVGNVAIARSFEGTGFANVGNRPPSLTVANGVTGGFGTISLAGRPIENALARNQGRDYDRYYTLNVGSYYEKAFTAYLFAESADNFISSSRDDFVDPRFRAVSLADVFPDGFRRWLANNLTNDEALKGVYVRAKAGGGPGIQPPELDSNGYALLGTTSWWPTGTIEACFPSEDRIYCNDKPLEPIVGAPAAGTVVDPQVGWEQQKFAMVFSLLFIPDNQRRYWIDQMRIYDVSIDNDPDFDNRIEFHDPNGKTYVAQTSGTEVLFGREVQKSIGARVLEYANSLLEKSFETEDVMRNGKKVGVKAKVDPVTGKYIFKPVGTSTPDSCESSRPCSQLKNYVSVPEFFIQNMRFFGYIPGYGLKGVY